MEKLIWFAGYCYPLCVQTILKEVPVAIVSPKLIKLIKLITFCPQLSVPQAYSFWVSFWSYLRLVQECVCVCVCVCVRTIELDREYVCVGNIPGCDHAGVLYVYEFEE